MPKGVYLRDKISTLSPDGVEVVRLFIKNLPVRYYDDIRSHAQSEFNGRIDDASIDIIRKGLEVIGSRVIE